ncbi:hypothetical protein [Yoonia sp. R78084]|uniref:hypothetical protein n=1 Tax=Yoonia sp. R78084 TaxID=3093869 RepID=UPI0037DD9D3F
MARRAIEWNVGDVFLVETEGGRRFLAQVIGKGLDTMKSALCAYTLVEYAEGRIEIGPADFITVQFTTRDLLERGKWNIVGNQPAPTISSYFENYEDLMRSGFFGVTVRGSGVIRKFLEACIGERYWDSFADPEYFEMLLLPGLERPPTAKLHDQS